MTDTLTDIGPLLEQSIAVVEKSYKPEVIEINIGGSETAPVALQRDSDGSAIEILQPEAFDAWRSKPLHRVGCPTLTSLDALIDYTIRFKDPGSVAFANDSRESPKIVSVLDYHLEGPAGDGGQRFSRHYATYPLPLSDEWIGWHGCDGKVLTMADFARFLEDHIVDVMDPSSVNLSPDQAKFVETLGGPRRMADPAKLMELATGLQIFEEGHISEAVKLQTGEAQITIQNQHRDAQGQQLVIPSMFTIAIPVFRSGDPYQIVARLRYRNSGGIKFFYELWRADRVFDHAFNEASDKFAEETGLTVFRGNR